MLFKKRIPIKLVREEFYLLSNEDLTYNDETLEDILYNDIIKQIEKFEFFYINEISREIKKTDKGMLLNINSHECSVDGEVLNLTPTEFQILQALFEHRGSVMSAESLFHEVWKEEYFDKMFEFYNREYDKNFSGHWNG